MKSDPLTSLLSQHRSTAQISAGNLLGVVSAAIATVAVTVQFGYSMNGSINRLQHRNAKGAAEVAIALARRIPEGSSFTATSQAGRYYARYALYPRQPARITFEDESEEAVRAELAAEDVRYVLVSGSGVPAYFKGDASWFRVVAEHPGRPYARLVVITE